MYKLYLETKNQYGTNVDRAKRESSSRLIIEELINPLKGVWNMINKQRKKDPVAKSSARPAE